METTIKKPDLPTGQAGKKSLCYLAIVLAIALLIFAGLLYYLSWKSEIPPEILTPEEEIELQGKVAEIIKTNDFNKCKEIKNELYRTVCINNIALNLAEEKQDINYCQKLDDKLVSIIDCERRILLEKSQDKEDINICNEIENSEIQKECQASFWPFLALKKEDIKLCDNITIEQGKNSCYDNYLFQQEFRKSGGNFDCQKFYSQEVSSDCQIYKEMILDKKLLRCDSFKSGLFLDYCLESLINL